MPVFDFNTFALNDPYTYANIQTEFQDDNDKASSVTVTSPQKLHDEEYQKLFEKLNQDER